MVSNLGPNSSEAPSDSHAELFSIVCCLFPIRFRLGLNLCLSESFVPKPAAELSDGRASRTLSSCGAVFRFSKYFTTWYFWSWVLHHFSWMGDLGATPEGDI
jgi:hypothetical protein